MAIFSPEDGFMVDSWWGITEPEPKEYNFAAYRELVNQAIPSWLSCSVSHGEGPQKLHFAWFLLKDTHFKFGFSSNAEGVTVTGMLHH